MLNLRSPPQPQTTDGTSFPAPMGGVNAIDSLSSMPISDLIYSFNLVPSQYGLKIRRGYQAWVTGLGAPVRTILPYNGSNNTKELWAATKDGIYEATASTAAPVVDTAFGITTGLAGWGSWTNFTIIGGQFIALCDEANGYFTYDGTVWLKRVAGAGAGQINGSDPVDFVFVVAWKDRLFFVKRDSASAWYLPVGQVAGVVAEFNFGTKFKHGGYLIGLYNWTIDGGEGVDDYLVALSSGGDVMVYKGTDPSSAAAFGLHGQWFIGAFPAGRRVASSFGGDLLLLTGNGVVLLSQLVAGNIATSNQAVQTRKISPVVNALLKTSINDRGWEINLLPQDDLLMISSPKRSGYPYFQFVQSLTTQGWYYYRNLPYNTGTTFNGELYFGDDVGSIFIHSGDVDNVNLAGSSFSFIEFSLLTSFQNFGSPTRYKRAQFFRPVFLSGGIPAFKIKALYDYNLEEIAPSSDVPSFRSLWDVALWDVDVWGGEDTPLERLRGGVGMGRKIAIAIRGSGTSRITLIEMEILFDLGGHI